MAGLPISWLTTHSLVAAPLALLVMCLGAVVGLALGEWVPKRYLEAETREILKTTSAMVATLVSLVLGLLIGSAKTSFDQTAAGLTALATSQSQLDRMLEDYGPEAAPARTALHQTQRRLLERIWPTDDQVTTGLQTMERGLGVGAVGRQIDALEPGDDAGRRRQKAALKVFQELRRQGHTLLVQASITLPGSLMLVLIAWLGVLFLSLGLLAPRNLVAAACLAVAALTMAAAIFLLIELSQPLTGAIQVSPGPLERATRLADD